MLAYTVRGPDRLGNGVYVMTLDSGDQQTLDAAAADYEQLAWSEKGTTLPPFAATSPGAGPRENSLLAWTNVGTPGMKPSVLEPAKAPGFPQGMVISEFTAPRWSNDGARILVHEGAGGRETGNQRASGQR